METIRLKCSCGASFERECNQFINSGGTPDGDGRVFLAEVAAERWLRLHQGCLPAPLVVEVPDKPITEVVPKTRPLFLARAVALLRRVVEMNQAGGGLREAMVIGHTKDFLAEYDASILGGE